MEIVTSLHDLQEYIVDLELSSVVREFALQINRQNLEISANDFFTVNSGLLGTVSTVLSSIKASFLTIYDFLKHFHLFCCDIF